MMDFFKYAPFVIIKYNTYLKRNDNYFEIIISWDFISIFFN